MLFWLLCNSLSNLICDIGYQWIEFTTTHCFTKLVENRTLATTISADMLLNPIPYYLIFHLRETLFRFFSNKEPVGNLLPSRFYGWLRRKENNEKPNSCICYDEFYRISSSCALTFQQKGAPSVSHCTSSPQTTIYSVAPNLTKWHSLWKLIGLSLCVNKPYFICSESMTMSLTHAIR